MISPNGQRGEIRTFLIWLERGWHREKLIIVIIYYDIIQFLVQNSYSIRVIIIGIFILATNSEDLSCVRWVKCIQNHLEDRRGACQSPAEGLSQGAGFGGSLRLEPSSTSRWNQSQGDEAWTRTGERSWSKNTQVKSSSVVTWRQEVGGRDD